MIRLDRLTRELHQKPDPSGGGQSEAGNQEGHRRPEGYVPETEAYITKQHQIWKGEKEALNAQLAETKKQATALQGYKELFDQMGSHPEYSKILQGWIQGYDLPTTMKIAVGQDMPTAPTRPDHVTSPDEEEPGVQIKQIEALMDRKIHQYDQRLGPALQQLHKLTADTEAQRFLDKHPDARNFIDGIERRVNATKGLLPFEDAYRLEAFEHLNNKAKEAGVQEGRQQARFESIEPPGQRSGPQPSISQEEVQRMEALLKAGQRKEAAHLAFKDALKGTPGAPELFQGPPGG